MSWAPPGSALSSSGAKRFRQALEEERPRPRQSSTTWSSTISRTKLGHGVISMSRPPPTAPASATSASVTAISRMARSSFRTAPLRSASVTSEKKVYARSATARTSGSATSSLMRFSCGSSEGAKGRRSAVAETRRPMFSAMMHACRCVRAFRLFRPLLSTGSTTASAGAVTRRTKTTSARSRTHLETSCLPLAQLMISSMWGSRSKFPERDMSTSEDSEANELTSLLVSTNKAVVIGNSSGNFSTTAASPSLPRRQQFFNSFKACSFMAGLRRGSMAAASAGSKASKAKGSAPFTRASVAAAAAERTSKWRSSTLDRAATSVRSSKGAPALPTLRARRCNAFSSVASPSTGSSSTSSSTSSVRASSGRFSSSDRSALLATAAAWATQGAPPTCCTSSCTASLSPMASLAMAVPTPARASFWDKALRCGVADHKPSSIFGAQKASSSSS
mmetsp:Transcript_36906/g.88163  ORF Transcript_36906/g.88163 Transcript_36906/m.88163 type:complete len:449 (-) Transcript_36906:2022-3368(-)